MGWPVIHGKHKTRVYQAWVDMLRRCTNPSRDSYANYGGRGISVCPEWMSFKNFYADMGDPPAGMSIERDDVHGNYEKSNCRWATISEQALNRTYHRFVVVDGERMAVAVASRRYGILETTLRARLDRGMPDEQAVKTPRRAMSKWTRKCA
jgi:hypothetical protein